MKRKTSGRVVATHLPRIRIKSQIKRSGTTLKYHITPSTTNTTKTHIPLQKMFAKKVFVTPAEVKAFLPSLRIFDLRYSLENPKLYGITEHNKLRIAGSAFVDLDEELCAPHSAKTTARHPLPDCSVFVDWCRKRGIGCKGAGEERPILCYDDFSGGMAAARLWWMLDAVGIEAYILSGGIQQYVAEGLPTESGPNVSTTTEQVAPEEWKYATSYAKSLELEEVPLGATIVDARFAIRYNSTVRPYGLDSIPGHPPGSVNHPWNSNLDESAAPTKRTLLDESVLRDKMTKTLAGAASCENFVFTCASGVTACMNIAVARHLGFGSPYLYAGAWSEYQGRYAIPLRRAAIETFGFCVVMRSKNLAMNPKATADNAIVTIDGCDTPVALDALSDELKTAVASLHVGESGTIHFKSGKVVDVTVAAK